MSENNATNATAADKYAAVQAKAKSSELREAEAEVSSEAIELTPAEQREIDELAASEAERSEMIDELKTEKMQQEAMRIAREKVNPEVPLRHIVARPTYGPITGRVDYHMRETYSFLLGRSGNRDHYRISGLFEAASNVRAVAQGYVAECPYAAWYLVQIEKAIVDIRKKVKSAEAEAQALIRAATELQLEPFTSKRPASVPLDFRVAYGFHFADLLISYDRVLRMVKSYEIQRFVSHADFLRIEEQLGKPLRRLFRLPYEWSFVGKDAVLQETSTFLAAQHKMGILPDEILDGSLKPTMV